MKSLVTVLLFSFVLISSDLFSQSVFKDDFSYAPSDSIEGSGGWYRSGINTPYNIKVLSPGLTYSGYAGSGIGNTLYITNQGEGDIVYHPFSSAVTSGAVYMSLMIRIDSLSSAMTSGYCIGFNPNTVGINLNTRLYVKKVTANTFNFGIYKSRSAVYGSTVYNANTTYLAVLKYSFVNGNNNDSAKLYVFSSGVPSTEPLTPLAFSTDSIDFGGQGRVFVSNNYAQTTMIRCSIKLDGIRIGNSWTSSVLSSVNTLSNEIPENVRLYQNYPNPFNPSTVIRFDNPQSGIVVLKIYDVLGNEIKTLINENMPGGKYEVDFNASSTGELPSGVYFYRLQTGSGIMSKSMMLVR